MSTSVDKFELNQEQFDFIYGNGMYERIQTLINDLAPTTRRDEWWATSHPYELIARHWLQRQG